MPSIKQNTQIHNSVTMTAAAGDVTSSSVDLSAGYGAELFVKLTNGATGPTLPAQVQIEVSGDNSKFFEFGGAMVGLTGNNGVISWTVDIPIGIQYVRLVTGSNTAQDVTIDADISQVTKI